MTFSRWGLACLLLFSSLRLAAAATAKPQAKQEPRLLNEAQRQEKLAVFFKPRPGQMLVFKNHLIRDFSPKDDPLAIYGTITITPPAKSCLTITRHRDEPDVRVCRPSDLSFSAKHLADDGSISWEITRDNDPTPTTLRWLSPYRLATFVAKDAASLVEAQQAPLVRCQIVPGRRERVIYVDILGQEPITVSLPMRDEAMAAEEIPNLYMAKAPEAKKDQEEDKEGHEAKEKSEHETKKKPDDEKAAAKGSDHATSDDKAKGSAQKKAQGQGKEDTDKASKPAKDLWRLVPRGSFTMSADHVFVYNLPRGSRGLCRYRLQGAPHDAQAGAVECHRTDHFLYFYTHLPCLKDLP